MPSKFNNVATNGKISFFFEGLYIYVLGASQVVLGVKNSSANAGRLKRCRFNPWVGKIPWRRAQQSTPVFLPGESMDRGAWWATVRRVTKSRT